MGMDTPSNASGWNTLAEGPREYYQKCRRAIRGKNGLAPSFEQSTREFHLAPKAPQLRLEACAGG
jgi:hypothetical protein